jgi:rhodanese-related sulfurtransferase/DNA-binding transcriptional ArsR family regulator
MSRQSPKQVLFAHFAAVAKTLGNAHRLELLEQLAQGERSVEILARKTGLTVANASQHLQHMRRAGLVTSRRDGTFIHYRLTGDDTLDVLSAIRKLAERNLAEVERVVRGYFQDRDGMEPVSRKELDKRLREGSVTVLDVRPADEFALGHVRGAISMPLRELEARMKELDPAKEIVAYCRGAYCVFSFEAVAKLRSHGFTARRLEEGLPEWRAAGLPVDYEAAT